MLTKRIIPCLDIKDGRVVKGKKFASLRDAGDPAMQALRYYEEGADELAFLDISAGIEKRKTVIGLVKDVAKNVFIPLTVGGGISTCADIQEILKAGADKVSVNSAAVLNPGLIKDAAARFGSQCIVIALDAKKVGKREWKVCIKGGRQETSIDAIEWAGKAASLGAGEILLTSIDRDGTNSGYDIELIKKVSESVRIPVIASGGAGSLSDILEAFRSGKADACLAASMFHYEKYTITQVKEYLRKNGVDVRS